MIKISKKGFTLVEMSITTLLFGVVCTVLFQITNMISTTQLELENSRRGAASFDYIVGVIYREIKTSNAQFEIKPTSMRIYAEDGTFSELAIKNRNLTYNGEKLGAVSHGAFKDMGAYVEVNISFSNLTPIRLEVYKANTNFV